ncbi:MAG: cyclic nucleotide-binding domain-containing protein [Desulfococcaceae bacterium]|jgi:CRP-like cAMP-binding protein|nr:cyclic nucleotide-binding domain-containing protein [Desulfococcaceae bacterium]
MSELTKQEEMIEQYVSQNRTEEAVKLLFDLIVKYAKAKDFVKAESLREKLFEIDSMALTEIIKSAEIIEEEKSESVDSNHMEIWKELYEKLTTEESNVLYFSLQKKTFYTDEIVFRQGQKNDRLWFVDRGQLKLVYSKQGNEKLINKIGPATVAGSDTFFSISVCTTSLISMSRAELNYLDTDTFAKLREEHTSLASKLETYCAKQAKDIELLREKGINRRSHKRLRISGPILFQVMNAAGNPIGKAFKGELSDISVGGLSFFITTANRKNALMLLGRKMKVKFRIPVGSSKIETKQSGTITGVINHLFTDYSIHMKFDNPLSKLVVEEMELIQDTEESGPSKVNRRER